MNEMQYFVSFRLTFYCCNEINGKQGKTAASGFNKSLFIVQQFYSIYMCE